MTDGEPPSGGITRSGKTSRTTLVAAWWSAVRDTLTRRRRLLGYLAILGPGMIAASAGNDAGGIATFASVGAEHGYRLLWILIPITISLGLVQEMCARMGAVTGKGLADLIRERFGVRWTAFVMLALLIANGGVTVSEFVGIAAATELFGVPRFVSVPLIGDRDLVAGSQEFISTR